MIYPTLNYYSHLFLTSKHRILIHLLIIIILYSLLCSNKFVFCMNEDVISNEIPKIAETKYVPSQQILGIKREITTFAGSQAHLLERVDAQSKIIAEQQEQIKQLIERPSGDVFELEKIRVHEEFIAYFNEEPNQILEGFQKWRPTYIGHRHVPLYVQEKMYLQKIMPGVTTPNYYEKVHYLFRMYRRLNGI